MGIRVEHQALGALGAAFAAGRGKSRQRQQKYAMDLMRDERRDQNRFKYRAMAGGGRLGQRRLGGGQQGFGQQAAGTWENPFNTAVDQAGAASDAGDTAGRKVASGDAVRIRAQQRSNARNRRLGKPIKYQEADPQFKAAPTKEEIARKHKEDDAALGREQDLEDKAEAFRKSTITKNMGQVPPHLIGTTAGAELRKLYEGRALLRGKRGFNQELPETQESLAEFDSEIDRILEQNPAPDPVEDYNDTVMYRDPVTGKLGKEQTEGSVPGHVDPGGDFVADEPGPEAAAAAEAAEGAKEEAAKQQESLNKDALAIMKELKDNVLTFGTYDKALAEAQRRRKLLDAATEPPAMMDIASRDGAAEPDLKVGPDGKVVKPDDLPFGDADMVAGMPAPPPPPKGLPFRDDDIMRDLPEPFDHSAGPLPEPEPGPIEGDITALAERGMAKRDRDKAIGNRNRKGRGVRWGKPKEAEVPIDADGNGPVSVIQTNPPVYVMRDGTKIRRKRQ